MDSVARFIEKQGQVELWLEGKHNNLIPTVQVWPPVEPTEEQRKRIIGAIMVRIGKDEVIDPVRPTVPPEDPEPQARHNQDGETFKLAAALLAAAVALAVRRYLLKNN